MLILTHIGTQLPGYIEFFIKQIRIWNTDYRIIFLVNENNVNNPIFITYNVESYPIEELHNSKIDSFISNFGQGSSFSHNINVDYGSSDYWCVTATRLFYLYEFCKKNNINDYFYFENDIMIYEDLNKIHEIIKSKNLSTNEILVTRSMNEKITTGFMYISNNNLLGELLDEINNYLLNKEDLESMGIGMINEMILLSLYGIRNPDKIKNLPLYYEGPFSESFSYFESIFDAASLGQYVDGTPNTPGQNLKIYGTVEESLNGQEFKIEFHIHDDKKVPYLITDSKITKINNLHLHSKRLHLFLSN